MKIIGIDFGSKIAGTTAVCFDDGGLTFLQSQKGRDADSFVIEMVNKIRPQRIFIDAPLSLPIAYFDKSLGNDFFYRLCDRELKAMSPMFLGGLTARAIKLKHHFHETAIDFYEAYPRGLVNELVKEDVQFWRHYKSDLKAFADLLIEKFEISLAEYPANWHQCDAMLAFLTGLRFQNGNYLKYGDPGEGLIYV